MGGNRHDVWLQFCDKHADTLIATGLPKAITYGEHRFRDLLRAGEAASRGASASLADLSQSQWFALEQFVEVFFNEFESYAPLKLFSAFRREADRRGARCRLYDYLLDAIQRKAALVLTFDDGDVYSLDDVDLCYSTGRDGSRETEPLCVSFEKCRNASQKRLQALRDGRLKTLGVAWTSTQPSEPVGMRYGVENVVKIWDDDNYYAVYERNAAPESQ